VYNNNAVFKVKYSDTRFTLYTQINFGRELYDCVVMDMKKKSLKIYLEKKIEFITYNNNLNFKIFADSICFTNFNHSCCWEYSLSEHQVLNMKLPLIICY